MTKEQILETLAPIYRDAMDRRNSLMDSYINTSDEDDVKQAKSIYRDLKKQEGFRDGIETIANSLGITIQELIVAAITKS